MFVDYDGTITDLDTFDELVRAAADPQRWRELEDRLHGGTMSLREVLAAEASFIRWSLDEADAYLARTARIEPAFVSFVARAQREGVPLTILSSGVEPLIERALARSGLGAVPVLANGVDADPSGWKMSFRDASDNGHDKAAEVRAAQERGARVTFVGDGHSDFEAALQAEVRFAKRGRSLERFLYKKGVEFTPFTSFREVELALFG